MDRLMHTLKASPVCLRSFAIVDIVIILSIRGCNLHLVNQGLCCPCAAQQSTKTSSRHILEGCLQPPCKVQDRDRDHRLCRCKFANFTVVATHARWCATEEDKLEGNIDSGEVEVVFYRSRRHVRTANLYRRGKTAHHDLWFFIIIFNEPNIVNWSGRADPGCTTRVFQVSKHRGQLVPERELGEIFACLFTIHSSRLTPCFSLDEKHCFWQQMSPNCGSYRRVWKRSPIQSIHQTLRFSTAYQHSIDGHSESFHVAHRWSFEFLTGTQRDTRNNPVVCHHYSRAIFKFPSFSMQNQTLFYSRVVQMWGGWRNGSALVFGTLRVDHQRLRVRAPCCSIQYMRLCNGSVIDSFLFLLSETSKTFWCDTFLEVRTWRTTRESVVPGAFFLLHTTSFF
ncbi:hypothetical protein E6O75_ATG09323 [Venturia nashicola]|uniref:Uncharacterized protein n=1 Tax=Venturia nashicola TaxID=86259 RepID=A0A4Z1NZJ4_9PEZI|nr:hypothetical protein E6O75_ATG09323 [Venturia nashicola]